MDARTSEDRCLRITFDLNVEDVDGSWRAQSHSLGFVFRAPSEDELYAAIDEGLTFFSNAYVAHKGLGALRRWLDARSIEHVLVPDRTPYCFSRSVGVQLAGVGGV